MELEGPQWNGDPLPTPINELIWFVTPDGSAPHLLDISLIPYLYIVDMTNMYIFSGILDYISFEIWTIPVDPRGKGQPVLMSILIVIPIMRTLVSMMHTQ